MAKSGMSDVESDEEDNNNDLQKSPEPEINSSNNSSVNGIRAAMKPSTPVSILIESLVKSLCLIYEPNEDQANQIYNLVCNKLFEMKLIDESFNMTEFEGMRNQYQIALYRLVSTAIGGKQPPQPSLQSFFHNNAIINDWSYYYNQFKEVKYIGGGGYGRVYLVKNKLDETEYAVKKILISSDGIQAVKDYLSEVKTFASLNHINIAQYKTAWLELGVATSKNAIVGQSDGEMQFPSETETETEIVSQVEEHIDDYIYPQAISDTETIFADNKNVADSSDFEVSFENSEKIHQYSHSSNSLLKIDRKMLRKSSNNERSSISEGGNAICRIEEIQDLHVQAKSNKKWATLYIQMALCQSTLKQWLEVRNKSEKCCGEDALVPCYLNKVRAETILEILRQLLKGIEYIHSKNIVHHDIKPSNVFIQTENDKILVQLGDFGLACPLQSARHSLAFGTKLYAAPEQLLGHCNPKSDMYSLGIVLLELIESYSTDMERVGCIMELRKGILPAHLFVEQPQFANMISQLIAKHPSDRPDATTLLQRLTVNVGEPELVQELRSQLAEKDEEICRLKEMLKSAGIENV